jgi:hypothetical protein
MKTYTKKEIAYLLKISVRTVEDDARALKLSPTQGDRGENLYSQSDYNLIRQMRKHCADKTNTRDSFVPSSEVEIMQDDHLQVTRIKPQVPALNLIQESLELGLSQDPLFDLELLQRISDRAYLLPTSRLAPILGISPKYLSSKKNYCHCGFILNKEAIVGGKILWKVSSNSD